METNKLLPKFVHIQTTSLHNFVNAMHTRYHGNQYELVTKVEQAKLNIPAEALEAWKAGIDMEVEINKQSAASEITKELAAKDNERDKVLTQLFGVIKVHRQSFVEAESKAAEKIYAKLKPYFGIQRDKDAVESTHIDGLLKDTERLSEETTTLGLTTVLIKLKTLNEEFKKLDAARRSDAVAAKLPEARKVRLTTDEDFELICQYIQAAYLFAKSKDDKELILTLTDEMNRVDSDLKASHKASASLKAAAGGSSSAGGKKPGSGSGKKKETEEEKLARLLPEFEKANDYAAGSLSITGKTFEHEGSKIYQISINKSETDTIWVQVKRNKLVQVGYVEV